VHLARCQGYSHGTGERGGLCFFEQGLLLTAFFFVCTSVLSFAPTVLLITSVPAAGPLPPLDTCYLVLDTLTCSAVFSPDAIPSFFRFFSVPFVRHQSTSTLPTFPPVPQVFTFCGTTSEGSYRGRWPTRFYLVTRPAPFFPTTRPHAHDRN